MEPLSPVLFRRKTLTNSAAEFVETRGGPQVFSRLVDLENSTASFEDITKVSEFITEIDRFAPRGIGIDTTQYYHQSKASMEAFHQALTGFVVLLKNRKVDAQLNIVIKDPSEFTIPYILDIVNCLGNDGQNPSKMTTCKKFVQSCYKKAEENKGVVEGLLTMIPNDAYGSVISGGFMVILAAIEKHFKEREEIQNWLAEIPEQLERIQRLTDIHYTSIGLHSRADAIAVAVFKVLECIVDKITSSWTGKVSEKTKQVAKSIQSPFRSKTKPRISSDTTDLAEPITPVEENTNKRVYKMSVSHALDDLKKQIKNFQDTVEVCNAERLGRVEVATSDVRTGMVILAQETRDLKLVVQALIEGLNRPISKNAKGMLESNIMTLLYRLCASSPGFDPKTGGLNLNGARLLQQEEPTISLAEHQDLAAKWQEGMKKGFSDPIEDAKDCLEHVTLLDFDDKTKPQWILNSDELKEWLQAKTSKILDIQLHNPPDSLNNPLSFTSALMTSSLQMGQFPVLSFFCMHRNNESCLERKSGALGLVRSFNFQLINFIASHRPSMDLSLLQDKELISKKAKKNLTDGLRLLRKLLSALPEDDTVFIVIDSYSKLSGDEEDGDKILRMLKRVMEKNEDLVIKLLITDAFPGSYAEDMADISLNVPDMVSGFGFEDIDESFENISRKVKRGSKSKSKQIVSDDEEDDEDDDEDDSDDDSD